MKEEGEEGEDEMWARHCCHHCIVVVVSEGGRVRRVRTRRRRGTVITTLLLLLHVGEARMGEDEVWARHCCRHHIIVIACEGRRVRSGWVRTRDGRGAVVTLSLSLSLSLHVRVGEDKAWARRHCCCHVWREGGRGGYENLCCRYGYERRLARLYLYLYPCDTCHMTHVGYPYPWYTLDGGVGQVCLLSTGLESLFEWREGDSKGALPVIA